MNELDSLVESATQLFAQSATPADLENAKAQFLGKSGRVTELMKRAPKGFSIYSGNDDSALAYIQLGASGVISVTANVAPRLMSDMCKAALAGENAKAIAINNRLLGLHKNLFLEANPIPVKWALQKMGRIAEGIRLPLTPFASQHHETLAASLKEAGCIA